MCHSTKKKLGEVKSLLADLAFLGICNKWNIIFLTKYSLEYCLEKLRE